MLQDRQKQRIDNQLQELCEILNLPVPCLWSNNPDPELREVEDLENLAAFMEQLDEVIGQKFPVFTLGDFSEETE